MKRSMPKIQSLINDVHNYGINPLSREIYLHSSYIGGDMEPGVEYRMATTFVKNFHLLELQNNNNILVHMHTVGGEWNDGTAIYHTIKMSKSPVTILAYAQASSMSGIIFQSAYKRILMPDCEFLIHLGSIALDNITQAFKSSVLNNDRITKRMMEIFAARAVNGEFFKSHNMTIIQVAKYIEKKIRKTIDWYMSAEEAVKFGFADGILGQKGFEDIEQIRK